MKLDLLKNELSTIQAKSSIFFGVLNWGLGHATRSSVVIKALVDAGHDVHIGSDGEAGRFLQETFPSLSYHALPEYRIQYRKDSMFWNMLLQGPKIFSAIAAEKNQIIKLYDQYNFDLIISDNRYGIYHRACINIILTHQLQIFSQPKWTQTLIQVLIENWLKKFDKVWVPDFPDSALSGELSAKKSGNTKVRFVGPLSILSSYAAAQVREKVDIVCLLSGPEPQRSKLETILVEQLEAYVDEKPIKVVLIRGKIQAKNALSSQKIKVIDFCREETLAAYLVSASIVICRSGYSTIMDLEVFNKRALLIPTPGQPEQEYLAQYLSSINKKYETLSQRELKEKLLERLKMEG